MNYRYVNREEYMDKLIVYFSLTQIECVWLRAVVYPDDSIFILSFRLKLKKTLHHVWITRRHQKDREHVRDNTEHSLSNHSYRLSRNIYIYMYTERIFQKIWFYYFYRNIMQTKQALLRVFFLEASKEAVI